MILFTIREGWQVAQRAKKAAEKSAKKAAAEELRDGGEDVYLMEPMHQETGETGTH